MATLSMKLKTTAVAAFVATAGGILGHRYEDEINEAFKDVACFAHEAANMTPPGCAEPVVSPEAR